MTHDNVTDIVGRLRKMAMFQIEEHSHLSNAEQIDEAADVIEAQQSDLATLRKQLENARSEALEEAAAVVDPPLMHRKGNVGLWRKRRAAMAAEVRALKAVPR